MKQSEIDDIDKNWAEWFPKEEIPRIGMVHYWAIGFNHPCFLAAFLHDIFYPDEEGVVFHYLSKFEVDILFNLWWSGCISWQELRGLKLCLKWLCFERMLFYRVIRLFKRGFVFNDKKTFNDFGLSDRLKARIAEKQKRK